MTSWCSAYMAQVPGISLSSSTPAHSVSQGPNVANEILCAHIYVADTAVYVLKGRGADGVPHFPWGEAASDAGADKSVPVLLRTKPSAPTGQWEQRGVASIFH